MEQARLEVELRIGNGKGHARSVRRSGLVPGIVYGHKLEPINVQLPARKLRSFSHAGGENVIINMEIKNSGNETVMLKEMQIDPLTREIIHADFMRVSLEERITTHVPIALTGAAPGIKEGGILEFLLREVRLECEAGRLPEHIEVDISSLNIGDQIRVADVKVEDGMIIHDDPATIVVTVATPTLMKEPTEGELLGAEDLEKEPELIEKRRAEEEEE